MVMAQAFNPSTQEAEASESQWVQGQPGLQSEFQDSQDYYTEKPCLKKNRNKKGKKGEKKKKEPVSRRSQKKLVRMKTK